MEIEAQLLDADPHNEKEVALALHGRNVAKEFAYAIAMRFE